MCDVHTSKGGAVDILDMGIVWMGSEEVDNKFSKTCFPTSETCVSRTASNEEPTGPLAIATTTQR